MAKKVIQIMGDALNLFQPERPLWLHDMDFEANDGRGHATMTEHLHEAKRFDSAMEAITYLRTSPKCKPTRPDGLPNRPLTAYHCNISDDNLPPL